MKFRIKNSQGTYYKQMTGIGPMFGASDVEAMQFDTAEEAQQETMKHSFAFWDCEIEGFDTL